MSDTDNMVDDELCELALDRKEDITHEEAAKQGHCTMCKYKDRCLGFQEKE